MPMDHVQQILGHDSIATTANIYGQPSVGEIQEKYIEEMEGLFG